MTQSTEAFYREEAPADFDLSCNGLLYDMAIYPLDAEMFQCTATPAIPPDAE